MALVDYSSESAAESAAEPAADVPPPPPPQRPAKRRKYGRPGAASPAARDAAMPPLPASFHDLYAVAVRPSVADDPSLHNGRKRQTPHVPGHWPTYLYVEWRPTEAQHRALDELLARADTELGDDVELRKLLVSDLGAHLPLHISLSRPLSLRTADKDDFLDKVTRSIRSSGTPAFSVRPGGLAWFCSPDSDRTFLILRVVAPAGPTAPANAQLMKLLTRCNAVCTSYNQPALYQKTNNEPVDAAFHVSIAWAFFVPEDEASLRVLGLFKQKQFEDLRAWDIEVSSVKAKIGNVVSDIPLVEVAAMTSSSLLFEKLCPSQGRIDEAGTCRQ